MDYGNFRKEGGKLSTLPPSVNSFPLNTHTPQHEVCSYKGSKKEGCKASVGRGRPGRVVALAAAPSNA